MIPRRALDSGGPPAASEQRHVLSSEPSVGRRSTYWIIALNTTCYFM